VALLGVDEIGKFERIAHEEYRRVVADDVPVALFGIEAQREPAHVALGVGGSALTRDGRESEECLGLLADLGERLGLGISRDVVGDGQRAVGAGTLGVLAALGNALAVLVGKLLEQKEIFEQHRAARAGGDAVLIVGDGHAAGGGECRTFGHGLAYSCDVTGPTPPILRRHGRPWEGTWK